MRKFKVDVRFLERGASHVSHTSMTKPATNKNEAKEYAWKFFGLDEVDVVSIDVKEI